MTVCGRAVSVEALTRRVRELEDQIAAAERRNDAWVSILSHHLRGPLTLILGYGDNVLRRANSSRDSSRSIRDLEAVVEGARRQAQRPDVNHRPVD